MKHFFYLVFYKAYTDLISEVSRTYLSFLWWFFDPIFTLIIYYIVFAVFLQIETDNYVAFLLIGLIPWQWFNRTVQNSVNSIINSGNIISKVNINKLLFPTVIIATDLLKNMIIFLMLLIFLNISGFYINEQYIFLLLLILTQLIFITASSYLVALIAPFFPDLQVLLNSVFIGMMFASGLFFSPEQIPEQLRQYFFLNPMAIIIVEYRNILIYSLPMNLSRLFIILISSIAVIVFSLWFVKKTNNHYFRLIVK